MGSLLAALTTIIVTTLAALFALPFLVDWNDYRSAFEAQAAKMVGRPVRLEGNIDLSILPVPYINLRGVRVADEFGKFEKPFADIEGLNVTLALPPLLSGTIEAKSIELDQPVIRLKVDEFGEGSWQSIGPHGLQVPIPVTDVVLNNVEIQDGSVELRRVGASLPSRIDRISGSFSADSLTGPFRFGGVGAFGGEGREIRLSAGRLHDSTLRLKASFRSADGVSLYQLDGDIKGLDGPVHYVGPVSARLALDHTAKTAKPGQFAEPLPGKAVEMRATGKITLDDAKLDDITLTVTQNDRPQSLTGSAYAAWGKAPRLDLTVESSWLDLDQMLRGDGTGARPVPSAAIAALPKIFQGWSFTPRQGQIKAKIQQAGLGGDVVERLDFTASHDVGGWRIDTLAARLPGETDIDVKGTLPAGEALGFNGDFTLNGKNLSRVLRWAAPSLGVVDAGDTQNFSLSSKMTLTPAKLAFHDAKGSLGDSSFTVDLIHDYGAESKLLLALQSERLDLRRLYAPAHAAHEGGTDPDLAALAPAKSANDWSAETVPARKTSLIDVLQTVFKADQSDVSLLIAKLQMPDFEARDIRSAFRYENGTFDIKELNLASTDGLRVKADGRITGFDSSPDGALNVSIDAPSAQSVTNLTRLAGIQSFSSGAKQRMDALAPFRLSGNLSAIRKERLMKLTLAGNAGGSELTFTGRFAGDLDALQNARLDVNGMIANADGHRLIAQLAPEVSLDAASGQAGAGVLKISALGALKGGLVSRIELQTPQARGHFAGEIGLLDEPSWTFKGSLDMRASQAATALSMLRLSPGGSPVTGAIDLRAEIAKEGAKYGVTELALAIGGETIRGTAEVDMSSGRPAANIDIKAASASLPKIAAYLVDWDRQDLTAQIAEVTNGGSGFWPNQAFSLAALQSSDGTLKLKAASMNLSEDLTLADARLEATLESGLLTLSKLDGQLYGGKFSASGKLKALPSRAAVEGKLQLANVELSALTRGAMGSELAKGKADFSLSVEGQGFSPRGMLTVLNGSGELRVGRGAFNGLTPAVLKKAASTYLTPEIPDKDKLAAVMENDLRKGSLPYPAMTLPLQIKDGVVRLTEAEVSGDDYRATGGVMVDLSSLRADSEWEISYTGKSDDGQRLPPVRMVYAGSLSRLHELKAALYADQFERFLTMRRMNSELEKLEKLGEQRGLRGHVVPNKPVVAPPPSASSGEQPGNPDAAPAATIPTQSVFRGPPIVPGQPDTNVRTNHVPGQTPNAPAAGWSTGVETADKPGSSVQQPSPQQQGNAAPAAPPGNFEAQIREVLGSQGERRDSYSGTETRDYPTQSYTRGGGKVED